ncbi:cysteine desulfurase [Parvibaculum sp.]|mgnify:CR=1 FL=1|jgi:cysteine desulfurase / selenocysteine lyase|uniref:cysteine desulfurase n=1 Tax=Parvibaculum sp. TaxID=2024848 RepID=UPI000C68CE40|nr:cysteine desulfurase [Parvibaculum sp.]MAM96125.1 cysteine desulfurase [Parvibaculum sp.]|tara:strand:- start:12135 stop:13379 length:1245 start_codon:yes stop_codon:yes gene_type:complete
MNVPAIDRAGYDVEKIRSDFPILSSTVYGKPLVYLDNAASAQKPQVVIDAINDAYAKEYSNVHRGMHYLSNTATEKFEQSRETARAFLNAASTDEIVFTSGATDAINLVASSFAEPRIEAGDEIILSVLEHHSNIVPWHYLRERHGAVLKYVPVTDEGDLDVTAYEELFTPRTKIVALTQMSNALGSITPIKEMIRLAHERGVPVLVDGCQGVVHMPTDVRELDCDFLVCSGHKLYGPTGIGLLYGKAEHLKFMRPYRGGGEMIREVSLENVTYAAPPHRFEAGTPAIVQAIGLGAALSYIQTIGREKIAAHETRLRDYATHRLSEISSLRIIGTTKAKGSIVSFVMENAHPHDIATVIDRAGVAVRAGHHCAQPVMERFGVGATTRASFGMYNTLEEVDRLAEALIDSKKFFG